jgi:hypothetical protein
MVSDPVPDPETVRGKHKGLLKVSTEELEEAHQNECKGIRNVPKRIVQTV